MNVNQLILHNIMTVQNRDGWKMADVLKAMADANNGIKY
jgi:hypothetical protein